MSNQVEYIASFVPKTLTTGHLNKFYKRFGKRGMGTLLTPKRVSELVNDKNFEQFTETLLNEPWTCASHTSSGRRYNLHLENGMADADGNLLDKPDPMQLIICLHQTARGDKMMLTVLANMKGHVQEFALGLFGHEDFLEEQVAPTLGLTKVMLYTSPRHWHVEEVC